MITSISTVDARKQFADIINKVAYGDSSIILTRHGEDIAAIVSIEELHFLQQIEDSIDIEDARKAMEEPGANIKDAEFWKELGL